ncbi:hypothetical protein U1Q18_041379, partial [Sarracenia purpurea var. burkii]
MSSFCNGDSVRIKGSVRVSHIENRFDAATEPTALVRVPRISMQERVQKMGEDFAEKKGSAGSATLRGRYGDEKFGGIFG